MPERIAKTDPFTQITEYVGSGPMKFLRNDWVPGAKAVFEKFADYKPRTEKADWLSGGKNIFVDRIEWVIMMICNDRRWPESYRSMGLQDVELIVLGYNTPKHNPPAPDHAPARGHRAGDSAQSQARFSG